MAVQGSVSATRCSVVPSVPGSIAVNSALRVVVHNWFVDGSLDGSLDGAVDGPMDGALNGAVDGVFDGSEEGLADGAPEGVFDGSEEGLADAAAVGATSMAVQGSVSATRCSVVPSVPGSGAVNSAVRVVVHNWCVGFR